jgi:ankyrin repeat protein
MQMKDELNRAHLKHSTCLHIATEKGEIELIDEIVQAGENVHTPDCLGRFPFQIAALNGPIAAMEKLLQHEAHPDLGAVDGINRHSITSTPLFNALNHVKCSKKLDAVKLLVTWGADINQVNQFGYSPLEIAVRWGNDEVAEFLRSRGADETIRRPTGWTRDESDLMNFLKGHSPCTPAILDKLHGMKLQRRRRTSWDCTPCPCRCGRSTHRVKSSPPSNSPPCSPRYSPSFSLPPLP